MVIVLAYSQLLPAISIPSFGRTICKAGLTPREVEICLLLLAGSNLADMQSKLSISRNTIKTHLRNIYRKTGVSNQKELLLQAWKEANSCGAENSQIR